LAALVAFMLQIVCKRQFILSNSM